MIETKLIEILSPLVPACVSFGPLFVLFGILFRTSPSAPKPGWKGNAFLIAGTTMITLALMSFEIRTFR